MDPSYLVQDKVLGANPALDWQVVEPARHKNHPELRTEESKG
jgi:hypothetical protein